MEARREISQSQAICEASRRSVFAIAKQDGQMVDPAAVNNGDERIPEVVLLWHSSAEMSPVGLWIPTLIIPWVLHFGHNRRVRRVFIRPTVDSLQLVKTLYWYRSSPFRSLVGIVIVGNFNEVGKLIYCVVGSIHCVGPMRGRQRLVNVELTLSNRRDLGA